MATLRGAAPALARTYYTHTGCPTCRPLYHPPYHYHTAAPPRMLLARHDTRYPLRAAHMTFYHTLRLPSHTYIAHTRMDMVALCLHSHTILPLLAFGSTQFSAAVHSNTIGGRYVGSSTMRTACCAHLHVTVGSYALAAGRCCPLQFTRAACWAYCAFTVRGCCRAHATVCLRARALC